MPVRSDTPGPDAKTVNTPESRNSLLQPRIPSALLRIVTPMDSAWGQKESSRVLVTWDILETAAKRVSRPQKEHNSPISVSGTICESSDCNSNGICIGTKNQFSCVCNFGYAGDRCQNRFGVLPGLEGAFCETKDCSGNGLCIGSKLLPLCTCAPGFIGLRCELGWLLVTT